MQEKTPAITISEGKINYTFNVRYIKEDSGMYSWYIPQFRMYFSSQNIEDGRKRARAMAKSFFIFWIEKQGFRSFVLELNNLGFKAHNHNVTMRDLIAKQASYAKFIAPKGIIPTEYQNGVETTLDGNLAMAV